jgi:hypothetical protein
MGIFRTATGQAIKEIIAEKGAVGNFGINLTHDSLDEACNSIVDLFEMALELRGHTRSIFGNFDEKQQKTQTKNQSQAKDFNTEALAKESTLKKGSWFGSKFSGELPKRRIE